MARLCWKIDKAGTLPQKIDNFLRPLVKPPLAPPRAFPKCAGDDIDPAHHSAIFVRAASGFAEKTGGVRVVDHRQRVVLFGEIANGREVRDRAVHRETTVGGNQSEARILRRAELRLQIAMSLCL